MDACAAMGEHRREHTRERSDGQAQMAENRPNAGAPHATRSSAYLGNPIRAPPRLARIKGVPNEALGLSRVGELASRGAREQGDSPN